MAKYDAAFLELTFASKERSLIPRRFSIHEGLSTLFEVNVLALSKDHAIDLDKIVGKNAGFRIMSGVAFLSSPGRFWTGVVSTMEHVRIEPSGESTYFLRIVPKLWLLTQRRGNRIFQRMTLPEIIQKVLEEWKIEPELELKKQYLKHDYVVQYGESDYAFICRLMERAGITYYFDFAPDEETLLVLSDEPHQSPARAGGPVEYTDNPNQQAEKEFVRKVRVAQTVTPGDAKIRDFDFRRRPDFKLFGDATPAAAPEDFYQRYHYLPGAGLRLDPPDGTKDATPVADDKGKVRTSPDALKTEAIIRLESARRKRRRVVFETNCIDFAPGMVFSIQGHPRTDLASSKKLLITGFSLDGHITGAWTFAGEAVFADKPYRPAQETPRPRIRGVQSAVVVGPKGDEIYTDEFGRVRVQFHWDREGKYDDNSSCWVRVSQGWAGAGFGTMLIPRVGHEVLIGFLEGDPDQPVVVGRVYNKTAPVPYKLPDHKTRSGWRSRSSPNKDGYNEIMLEDKKHEELFYVQAELDLQKLTKREETERTMVDRFAVIGRDRSDVIKSVDATMVGGRFTVEMIKPPSKGDLRILEQKQPKVSPRSTRMELKHQRLYFTTGKATVSFENDNIVFEANRNITIHSTGGDVVLEAGRVFINTLTPPPALSGQPIPEPNMAEYSAPPPKKPGLLSRLKTALVGALNLGAKVALTLKDGALKAVEAGLRSLMQVVPGPKDQKPFDGQFVGKGCEPSQTPPTEGVRPAKCPGGVASGKKIYYVNGINTKVKENGKFEGSAMCGNMHAIANTTCAEVIGVYNATEGFGRDLDECLSNIGRAGKTPAAQTLSDQMTASLMKDPPEPMTVFAHSQGGLITQEALIDTKARLVASGMSPAEAEQRMSLLQVKSFGTAIDGWPKGPQYERFTNTRDPVPYIIDFAQSQLYQKETMSDSAPAPNHTFKDKNVLIAAHSMDGSYMPYLDNQLQQQTGQNAQDRCQCR